MTSDEWVGACRVYSAMNASVRGKRRAYVYAPFPVAASVVGLGITLGGSVISTSAANTSATDQTYIAI